MIKSLLTIIQSIIDANDRQLKTAKAVNYLGRLPCVVPQKLEWSGRSVNVKRANRYLDYMERRLCNYRKDHQFDKATAVWAVLLKNSISYQLAVFNKSNPGWYYKLKESDTLKLFKACVNKARKWDLSLDIERFYLDKGIEKDGIPNGKLRPIGSPTPVSSFMSRAITDMTYFIMEDQFKPYQHGFRRTKSTQTALLEVWDKLYLENCRSIYEFDFQAFFNNVNWKFIARSCAKRSNLLASIVIDLLNGITYHHKNGMLSINTEEELKTKAWVRPDGKPKEIILFRKGLPQGLSISPLLATLPLEMTTPPRGLIMYADDGLIINNDSEMRNHMVVDNWLTEQVWHLGIKVAYSKSRWVKDKFKFLGTEFLINERIIKWEDKEFRWNEDEDLREVRKKLEVWLKMVPAFYGKKSEGYFWDVKPGSIIEKYKDEQFWVSRAITVFKGLRTGALYKGYKYFFARGTYHISNSSTWCCNDLLKLAKGMRPRKISRMNLGRTPNLLPDTFQFFSELKWGWDHEKAWEWEKPLYISRSEQLARNDAAWDWVPENRLFKSEHSYKDLKKRLIRKDRYLEWCLITNSTEKKILNEDKKLRSADTRKRSR